MDGRQSRPAAGWRVSLIIPAYNEAATIRRAVEEADAALARLAREYEILVIDDGSRDATARIVEDLARERPHVRLLRHTENRGYGAALRTGFEAAHFERVAFTDADCQFDLTDLASLLPLTDTYPVAVGRRVDRQDPWRRRFLSWGYNTLVRALLGTRVRDCDCALKVFRKEALTRLLPETDGFFVNTEMLARARQLGLDVVETGVRHRPRVGGTSKVSLADVPRTLGALLPFWWSRAVFAGIPTPPFIGPDKSNDREQALGGMFSRPVRRSLAGEGATGRESTPPAGAWRLLVLVAATLLFFTRLSAPLLEPDEARYAEIPRQMLAEGRLLVPVLHGQPYYDKPPLLYWLVMGAYQVFGVHDWAARLVPGFAALLTIGIVYGWGRRTIGPRAALAGALVLCLSARFVYLGRMLSMDVLLCLWVTAALAAAHVAVQGPRLRRGWWLVSAACVGLGVLTKGPVALVLIAVPLMAYLWLDPRTARIRSWACLAYGAVLLGVAGPWYGAMIATDPGFAEHFLWKHNVERYVAPFDHEEPVWFYLPTLLLGMLPWTLLLPPLLRFLGRRSARAAARRPAALGFFLLAFLWGLLFFSLSGSKRPGYVLPAIPPLALALGCYLDLAVPRERLRQIGHLLAAKGSRLAFRATVVVLGLGVGGSLLAGVLQFLQPGAALGLGAACALGLVLLRRRPAVSWAVCGAATFVLLLVAVHQLLPAYNRRFSLRGQVRPLAERLGPAQVPVVSYPRRWDSISFYLKRDDVLAYTKEQKGILLADLRGRADTLVFIRSRDLEDLLRDLPASLEYVPEGRQGNVTVGWVRPRPEAPAFLHASR